MPVAEAALETLVAVLGEGRGAGAQRAALACLAATLPACWPALPGHSDRLLAAALRAAALADLEVASQGCA